MLVRVPPGGLVHQGGLVSTRAELAEMLAAHHAVRGIQYAGTAYSVGCACGYVEAGDSRDVTHVLYPSRIVDGLDGHRADLIIKFSRALRRGAEAGRGKEQESA